MVDLLHFVFRGFWTFTGVLVLTCAVLNGTAEIIRAIRRPPPGEGGSA